MSYHDTQLNHRDRALDYARDVIWWTEQSDMNEVKFHNYIGSQLYNRNSWKRLTNYNKAYITGYLDRWRDEHQVPRINQDPGERLVAALTVAQNIIGNIEEEQASFRRYLDLESSVLWNSEVGIKLTNNDRDYVKGYMRRWNDNLNRTKIEWRVYHPKFGHLARKDYDKIEGRWNELLDLGATFWVGTDRVWYGDEEVFDMYKEK